MKSLKSEISREEDLLISLCRLEFTPVNIDKIEKLSSETLNWDYFSGLANSHGVAALVYHNLAKLSLTQKIPQKDSDFLRNALMMNISRNVNHNIELEKVLKLLNKNQINVVLLKGLALEMMIYGNSGLRQMSDVDVLISMEDCIKARDLLVADGFTSLPLKSPLYKFIFPYIGKHLPSLIRNNFSFEIHHELFGTGKSRLTQALYAGSSENHINEEKVFLPEPQLFFLYLVKHLFTHEKNNESQLRLYTDLVVLIEKYADVIFTPDLMKYAEEGGMADVLMNKLFIISDIWGVRLPAWLYDSIDRDYDQKDFYYFLRSPKNNISTDRSGFYRYNIKEIPGVHRKLIFIAGDLFPSLSFMKKRYNCKNTMMAILYYPHRFGKLWYLFKKQKGG